MNRRPSIVSLATARRALAAVAVVGLVATGTALTGCSEAIDHGYVAPDTALDQLQVGSSREQVLLVLGSPSTTATVGGEAFYYISQRAERSVAFLDHKVTSQKVLVVYFDDKARVKEVANYGLQDGKVFDFIERKTRTGGSDLGLISQIFKGVGRVNPLGGL